MTSSGQSVIKDLLDQWFPAWGTCTSKGSTKITKIKNCTLSNLFYRYQGVNQKDTLIINGSVEFLLTFKGPWSQKQRIVMIGGTSVENHCFKYQVLSTWYSFRLIDCGIICILRLFHYLSFFILRCLTEQLLN